MLSAADANINESNDEAATAAKIALIMAPSLGLMAALAPRPSAFPIQPAYTHILPPLAVVGPLILIKKLM
jgi:hypothetical protein